MQRDNAWSQVYEIVRSIPPGRVMSYGQVAELCPRPLTPRAIGWALHGCPGDIPWHRVVNAAGGCSTDRLGGAHVGRQRALLEAEGIDFSAAGKLDLASYRCRLEVEDLVEALVDDE